MSVFEKYLLFSELAWSISGFSNGFWVLSCSKRRRSSDKELAWNSHSSALASQPGLIVIVMQWHVLLSSGRGRLKRPPLCSSWHFVRASGGVRSDTHAPSLVSHPSLF